LRLWYRADCIIESTGWEEVKKIKVISDKNSITGSNFEQPRSTGRGQLLETRYEWWCNGIQKAIAVTSRYTVFCIVLAILL